MQERPAWRLWADRIAMGLCIVLASIGLGVVYDKATAVPAPAALAAQIPVCGSGGNVECSKKTYAKRQVKKFKKGKIGNAKGTRLPKKVKKMLAKKAGRIAAKDWDDWWAFSWKGTHCFVYLGQMGSCDEASEEKREMFRSTTRVVIGCGSNAILGAYLSKKVDPKKGWWGAGIGTVTCLYNKIYDKATASGYPCKVAAREPTPC